MSNASRIKRSREKKKALGLCRDCSEPVYKVGRCTKHYQVSVDALAKLEQARRRVPTFDDFCRLEDGE